MWYFILMFYSHFTTGAIQPNDKKFEFEDIRSVYYYNPESANRTTAIEICKSYNAWLISFEHYKEFNDVTSFFRNISRLSTGDDIRIQTSATKQANSTQIGYYQWNYHFKPSQHIYIFKWCDLYGVSRYPVRDPNYNCLMISRGKDKKWCYKNYNCNHYLPFICERKLSWPPEKIMSTTISEPDKKSNQQPANAIPNSNPSYNSNIQKQSAGGGRSEMSQSGRGTGFRG